VTDRPTKAHEYLFLLAKSKQYYYDAGAIAEACQTDTRGKPSTAGTKQHKYVRAYEQSDTEEHRTKGGLLKVADVPWHTRNRRTIWTVASHPFSGAKLLADYVGDDGIPYTASPDCPVHGHLARRRKVGMPGCDERSSKRGRILTTLVDHVETSESTARTANRTTQHVARVDSTCKCVKVSIDHFATFPPKLIEPCILAGAPRGGLVLDPFSGAGTTGLVAGQLGRDFLGIELNPEYCRMARGRIAEAA
jgi:site-specific DNA-methyltransferase (adenine-specific)